jgi:hypothetical protein
MRGEHDDYAEERSAGAASVWRPQVSPQVHASDFEDAPVLASGTQHTVWVVVDESLTCPRCDSHRLVQVKE